MDIFSSIFSEIIEKNIKKNIIVVGIKSLLKEAGLNIFFRISFYKSILNIIDIFGISIVIKILLDTKDFPLKLLNYDFSLKNILVGLFILFIVKGLIKVYVDTSLEKLRRGYTERLRNQLLKIVLYSKKNALNEVGKAELSSLLFSDIGRTITAVEQFIYFISGIITISAYSIIFIYLGKFPALVLIIGLLPPAIAAVLQRSESWQLGNKQVFVNSSLQRTIGNGINGLKSIQAMNAELWCLENFKKETNYFKKILITLVRKQSVFNSIKEFLTVILIGIWFLYFSDRVDIVSRTTLIFYSYKISTFITTTLGSYRSCLGSLPGYIHLLKVRKKLSKNDYLINKKKINFSISEKNKYKLGKLKSVDWVNKDNQGTILNLNLKRSKLIALVGNSGAGKTSLLDKLCGIDDVENSKWKLRNSDNIEKIIDGIKFPHLFKNLISYQPQDIIIFEASLKENLFLNNKLILDNNKLEMEEEIMRYFTFLNMEYMLKEYNNDNYKIKLSSDRFSGGEKKRIGLLRTLIKNNQIEVYDEPTTYLDKNLKEKICDFLIKRSKDKLIIISTHEPRIISQADEIIRIN